MEQGKEVAKVAEARLTPAKAIELLKQSNAAPEAVKAMEDLVKSNIAVLGETDLFVLRNAAGEIRSFRQSLSLTGKNGGLIQPLGERGPWVVSAQGYEFWQEASGTNVIFPQTVLVGQEMTPNPAVVRDKQNGRVLMVYARAIAFKYSSKGIPMVVDWTTIYDTPSYRMIDLLAKAKETPQAFKLLPMEMKPDKAGTWAKYPFDESTALWLDTSHAEVLKWFSSIINREKKSIDFAQTFARRNALKHISGLQKSPSGAEWALSVICWKPTGGSIVNWDASEYVNLQNRLSGMASGGEKGPAQIELVKGAERISEDVEAAGTEATTDIEDQAEVIQVNESTELLPPEKKEPEPAPGPEQPPKPPAPANGVKKHPAIANLEATEGQFPEEFKQACEALKINPNEIRVPEAMSLMKEINRIVDLKNA